jgi:hypothetical protein
MIDIAVREHLSDGVSIIVGAATSSGVPFASKGYGVSPIGVDLVNVFLDAREDDLLAHIRSSSRLAVTSGNVFTYQSLQLKGHVHGIEPATRGEHRTAIELCRRFSEQLAQLQNLPTGMFDRRIPPGFVTCTVHVDAVFDKSPGPMAGTRLAGPSS